MKRLAPPTAITLLLLIASCAASKHDKAEIAVHITDDPIAVKDETVVGYYTDRARHKHHDVVLYREMNNGKPGYQVRYYIKATDSFVGHRASFMSKINVASAAYKWTNDTTVVLRLYSARSKKKEIVTLWGNGKNNQKSTSISIDYVAIKE